MKARQKVGPYHPLSSHTDFLRFTSTLSPLAKAKPHLAPRTLLLASVMGAKLESLSKDCVLEEWVSVGLMGMRIKGKKLELVLDLGPEPLTRESSFRFGLLASEFLTTSRTVRVPLQVTLRTAEVPPPRAATSCKWLQLPANPCSFRPRGFGAVSLDTGTVCEFLPSSPGRFPKVFQE